MTSFALAGTDKVWKVPNFIENCNTAEVRVYINYILQLYIMNIMENQLIFGPFIARIDNRPVALAKFHSRGSRKSVRRRMVYSIRKCDQVNFNQLLLNKCIMIVSRIFKFLLEKAGFFPQSVHDGCIALFKPSDPKNSLRYLSPGCKAKVSQSRFFYIIFICENIIIRS